jgi:hypothetical protein
LKYFSWERLSSRDLNCWHKSDSRLEIRSHYPTNTYHPYVDGYARKRRLDRLFDRLRVLNKPVESLKVERAEVESRKHQ